MSQMNLLSESFFRVPSIPNIPHTLQLIETQKNLRLLSTVSLDQHLDSPLEDQELSVSIQLSMQPARGEVATATTITKRRKSGCTCKKTKCLKMYCECFREGRLCTDECCCTGCSNDQAHHDHVQRAHQNLSHKQQHTQQQKGCNCKKSQCQKKYCECYNAGIACSEACKCEDCANGHCDQPHSSQSQAQQVSGAPQFLSVLN